MATFDLAGIDDRTAAASGAPGHGATSTPPLNGRDDSVPVVLRAHQPGEGGTRPPVLRGG
jgi:hypothetical protein